MFCKNLSSCGRRPLSLAFRAICTLESWLQGFAFQATNGSGSQGGETALHRSSSILQGPLSLAEAFEGSGQDRVTSLGWKKPAIQPRGVFFPSLTWSLLVILGDSRPELESWQTLPYQDMFGMEPLTFCMQSSWIRMELQFPHPLLFICLLSILLNLNLERGNK